MATAVSVTATGNPDIDGLLYGTKWSGTVTYSFPDSPSDYFSGYPEANAPGFSQIPLAEQQAVNYAIGLISSYTNLTIQYAGTGSADIMIAQSSAANPTSYAYEPAAGVLGGDVWFGTQYNYSQAALGNYYFVTAMHELGHSFGLKHAQETGGVANVAVPTAHDDLEYSVMSYLSYVGAPSTSYTNEAYGYPQTYMANDILALQTLYGANFSTHSEDTVYSWSPTTGQEFINGVAQLAPGGGAGGSANRVFMTIWDGGGDDTYDMSNYSTGVSINLNPGASSITSTTQLAYLGNGHYAAGNVYNAYLYNNDPRSLIENADGGSGNDTIIGNAIANNLSGGAGNDTLTGGGGNDFIDGGAGTDTAVYSGNAADYLITYNSSTQTFTVADQRAGSPDGTDTVVNVENFQFADGVVSTSSYMTGGPAAPTIASFSPDSGTAGDGITNANQITLAGTAVAGSTVEVFDGATQIGTAVANGSGAWTFATATLTDGSHAFTTKAMDAAGNLSTASAALTVTVDTVAPGAPTVASFSPDSGTAGDGITNANHITLAGTAAAGSTVEVFDGVTQIGTAVANGSGAWTFATATLADGSHAFTTKAMDAAGNLSTASAALTVTVDTVAPGAPTVASFSPDSGTVGDGITNANHITLAGTAAAGSTVEVFDGATQIGTAVANGSGAWTFATATLADGSHAFTTKAMDAAGNLSTASAALTVTVDTVAPGAPTVASFSPDSGTVGDGITNANHITLAGTAAVGSTVEVFDGVTQIGTATANGSGAWTFATATLADGSHAFTTKAMDAAGNLSTASAALTVTVDTVAPGAPTVASFSPDSGTVGDGITNANHITLAGTAAVGSTVEVFDGVTQIGTAVANGSGAWTYATATLTDGSHAFTTKAMDAAGNLSTASAALNVTIDTVAPGAPTVASFSPDSGTVGDGITNANHITLAGTAVAGSTVEVFDGATQIGTAVANGSGAWTYATATLTDGSHAFTTKAMDAAGNLSTASAALTVTVDTVAPGAPTVASFSPDSGTAGDGITNANHITLAGTAVAGSTVEVFDGATQIGTAVANGSGAWTYATATLTDGSHAFTTKAMDAAGNLSTASAALTVTVDTVAPGAPTIVSDSTTATNSVDVSGTADAGSKVYLYEGVTLLGNGVANSSGNWNINTGPLSAGMHDFTATATDAAGNISVLSADFDPLVGVVTIESQGSTALVQAGNNYFLDPVAGGTGPELKYAGVAFAAGATWGAWAPIAAEATANGFEVVFKIGADTYTAWNTDANGNVTTHALGPTSGSNPALELLETTFHQDLNGDATIGVPPAPGTTTIESQGSTALLQTGNDYFLDPVAGGTGPELKYAGTAFTAGEWGAWVPIAAEATANGFEVVFKNGADTYTAWNTDANGNLTTIALGTTSGSNPALESLETTFQQDLNGDSTIGVPTPLGTTTIESQGSTALVQTGNNYFLDPVAGGTGPELKYAGVAFAAGATWGAWAPIAAEATANGFEVVFKIDADTYTAWNTDANGNVTTHALGPTSGSNPALESLETSFYQDLNGDGVLNSASTVIEASGTLKVSLGHVIQPAAIDAGSTLELTGTDTSSVTFNGNTGTLVLDHATQFAGTIIELTGDGTAADSDQIDLRDISFGSSTTVSYTGNASGGTLTIADAQNNVAHLSLVGNYTNSTFNLLSDGNGGTMVIDPPKDGFEFAPTPPIGASPISAPVAQMTHDGFVFVHAANAVGGVESPQHQSSVVGPIDAADHFFHQVWTEVSHEFAASPFVLDSHSLLAELHHFMLH